MWWLTTKLGFALPETIMFLAGVYPTATVAIFGAGAVGRSVACQPVTHASARSTKSSSNSSWGSPGSLTQLASAKGTRKSLAAHRDKDPSRRSHRLPRKCPG